MQSPNLSDRNRNAERGRVIPSSVKIQLVTAEKRDAGKMQEQVVLTKVIAYIQQRSHTGGCEFLPVTLHFLRRSSVRAWDDLA